jgi:hypothetical protein
MEISVNGIFPTPLLWVKIFENFSIEEQSFFVNCYKNFIENKGNLISENKNILLDSKMKRIYDGIKEVLVVYKKNILGISDQANLIITQSWLNKTEPEQYHHRHKHFNSIVSGVLYIQTIPNDNIVFERPILDWFEINNLQHTPFTSSTTKLSVVNGMLILFPSSLVHFVEKNNSSVDRISLSFNTFLTGNIGNKNTVTELTIKEIV